MNKPTDQDDIHYYSSAEIQFAFENQAKNNIFQKIEKWFIYLLFGMCFYFALIVLGGDFIAQYQAKDKQNIQTGCLYFKKWKNGVRYYQLEYVTNNKKNKFIQPSVTFLVFPAPIISENSTEKIEIKTQVNILKIKGDFAIKFNLFALISIH